MGRSKAIVATILMPIAFSVIAFGVYYLGVNQVWNVAYKQWVAAMIKGAPEYTYESMLEAREQATEGSLYYGEVGLPKAGEQFGEVICEKLEMKVPLYYGDSEVELEKGAGVYTAGGVPGEGRTILAGAHDATYFAQLEDIKKEDLLLVKTTYGEFQYKVTEIKIIDLAKEQWEMEETGTEQLLLYTCYPFGETNEARTQRYFVYAEKISGPEIKEANDAQ